MFEKIKDLIEKMLDKEGMPITMDTDIVGETGINSLELIELICTFEEEFNVKIPDKDIHKLRCIKDVVNYVEAKKNPSL